MRRATVKQIQRWRQHRALSLGLAFTLSLLGATLPALSQSRLQTTPDNANDVGAAQFIDSAYSPQTPALIFRANSGARAINFRLPLPEGAFPPTSQATVLDGNQIGALSLQVERDRVQFLNDYTWQLEPDSSIYLGRSGYKGVRLHYTYGTSDQPRSTLRLFCQTLDLRQEEQHLCRLSGSGELFQGAVSTQGRLDMGTVADALTPTLTAEAQQIYDRGFELGQRDRQINLSSDYQRYHSEYSPTFEADFREGYVTGYGNGQPRPNRPGNGAPSSSGRTYLGRGSLVIYPVDSRTQAQRHTLTRLEIRPETEPDTVRLVWAVENQTQSVAMQGIQAPSQANAETRLTLTAVDDIPAQGTLAIDANGRVRLLDPIFVGSNDQEIALDFRPN